MINGLKTHNHRVLSDGLRSHQAASRRRGLIIGRFRKRPSRSSRKSSAFVGEKVDTAVRAVLRKLLDADALMEIQKQVVEGQILAEY